MCFVWPLMFVWSWFNKKQLSLYLILVTSFYKVNVSFLYYLAGKVSHFLVSFLYILFLCSFSIAFWGCLVLFYFYLRFIKNFQIIREEFPFFSQFFTIHLNCCGGLAIIRNPGGRHSQALVGYATLPRFFTKLCLQGFFAWRNRLLCAVHGA